MKKKVLFLIESFIVGGAERVLLNLVNAMDKTKFDVTVISVFKKSVYDGYDAKFDEALSKDVHYKYLIDNTKKWRYLLFNYLFNKLPKKWFHRLLIGTGYDTEVAFYEGLPTTFISCSSNKKSKKIAWLHYGDGFADSTGAKRESYQKTYSKYDMVVGVSNGVCCNFKHRVGEHQNLISRYNVIDDERVRAKAKEFVPETKANGVSFVAVGRVCEIKGYDRLLRVCLKLHDEGFDFYLCIIGGGCMDVLSKYVADNSMQDYVHFLGHKDNPYPYIKNADWLICSSYAEGFSTVITESMIIGTPVISTDCFGTEELLGDNKWGIRCFNSEDGLYHTMKMVLLDNMIHEHYSTKASDRGDMFKKHILLEEIEGLF